MCLCWTLKLFSNSLVYYYSNQKMQKQQHSTKTNRGTLCFIIFAVLWEIAVGLIYGFFFGYNEQMFALMQNVNDIYPYSNSAALTSPFKLSSSQFPFPVAVAAIAIILLIVGLSMVAGYIQRSSVTGMAFTLLIFALTVQNFFIFRNFWQRINVNDPNGATDFTGSSFPLINFINFGNDLQMKANNYVLFSASLLDAVGCALALYAGYTAVIGRVGLGQIFFLTWIGTFLYEVNSQILWRLYIVDNGYPSRAFAFGGALGLVSSLVLNKRNLTINNPNFKSSYKIMALSFLGIIFVWCSFPVLVLSNVYNSATGKIIAMTGQVNIWLALAASVLGCYTASSFSYRKFCVHDMVFASITGAIAFSSSTEINYNPGAATAIGFAVGFICSLSQTRFKRKINENGVIDSNSVIFHFLLPSLFAAIFSAILSGVGQTTTSFSTVDVVGVAKTFTLGSLKPSDRTQTTQGGYQMAGWAISIGIGAVAGLIIGLIYKFLNGNFQTADDFFNDGILYSAPKINEENKKQEVEQPKQYVK